MENTPTKNFLCNNWVWAKYLKQGRVLLYKSCNWLNDTSLYLKLLSSFQEVLTRSDITIQTNTFVGSVSCWNVANFVEFALGMMNSYQVQTSGSKGSISFEVLFENIGQMWTLCNCGGSWNWYNSTHLGHMSIIFD